MTKQQIYVTGHKHPDSDSICSALAYAHLLNETGEEAIASRQGPLNEETKFILKTFGFDNPLLLTDARAKLSEIELDKPTLVSKNETVHHAWHVMLQTQNRSLFVVDEDNKLCGICTTSDLSRVRLHPEADLAALMQKATVNNISKTIGGEVVYEPENYKTNGHIFIISLTDGAFSRINIEDSIVILASNNETQKQIIELGAKCIVVTCGEAISEEVIELAKSKNCAVIKTENDTMHTARVITESYSIKEIMSDKIFAFNNEEYVDDVAAKMLNTRVRSYPVLDENENIVGAISRYHTRNYQRRRVALVDHSAVNQSLKHIETADIVAIIDHHHIGDIQTTSPIEYRNHRCGCTSTILTTIYKEKGITPTKEIAGLMMSAILSDTLNFKSATTTEEDKEAVKYLAEIAGIKDVDAYAREMLSASVALSDSEPLEILKRDLKSYEVEKYKFAIGQTNFSRVDEVQMLLPKFKEVMEEYQEDKKLDLLVMLFTDVMGEGSYFVYYGPISSVIESIIETKMDEHLGFDPNIISRKQQLMPKLSEAIKNIL